MKPNYTLRIPARQFTPATPPNYNTAILPSKSWAGVPLRERDRSSLPVLHHRGSINAAAGRALDAAPFGFPRVSYVEPDPYWGKQGTLVRVPRSIFLDRTFEPSPLTVLVQSAPDLAALSAARVFIGATDRLAPSGGGSGDYNGIFSWCMPWASTHIGDAGGDSSAVFPAIDGSTFTAGEVLVIFTAFDQYQSGAFGFSDPRGAETTLINSDVAQVAAALGSFKKLRYRIYGLANNAANDTFYENLVVAPAVAAGIDCSYTPGSGPPGFSSFTLASLQADYHSFFGI